MNTAVSGLTTQSSQIREIPIKCSKSVTYFQLANICNKIDEGKSMINLDFRAKPFEPGLGGTFHFVHVKIKDIR